MDKSELFGTRKIETLTVGDSKVSVRKWGGRQRLTFDSHASEQRANGSLDVAPVLPAVLALSVVNDNGLPLWPLDEITPEVLQSIEENVSAEVLLAVWDWACEANGLLQAGRENARKNS